MSSSPSWSPPPSFTKVSRGYWEYEVDRLIDDLMGADLAGEPMGPIVTRRTLTEVGFGYDSSEVDTYLARMCGVPAVPDTAIPASRGLRSPTEQHGERQPSSPEMPRETPYQVLEPYTPAASPRGQMEALSSQRVSARRDFTMNQSVQRTDSVPLKLTKSRKSVAIFIFVIVVLMTVLVLPTIFFNVVLPIFMG